MSGARVLVLAVVLVAWPAVLERFPSAGALSSGRAPARFRRCRGHPARSQAAPAWRGIAARWDRRVGGGRRRRRLARTTASTRLDASSRHRPTSGSLAGPAHPGGHSVVRGTRLPWSVAAPGDRSLRAYGGQRSPGDGLRAGAHPARACRRRLHSGTVLVTGMFGWLLGRLRERSGSVVAPMLAHLALNEAGAVATLYLGRSNVDLSPESASN